MIAEIAMTIGKILNFDMLASCFKWRIPHITSVLEQEDTIFQSPQFDFCDGIWTLEFKRVSGYCMYAGIRRSMKTVNHRNVIDCTISIKNDGKEYSCGKVNFSVGEKNWHMLVPFTMQELTWMDEGDSDLIIICFLQCYDCKSASQTSPSKSIDILQEDLKALLTSGEDSDMTVKVKEHEFRVHKNIVRTRSPVFFAMLKHELLEKSSRHVDITDCEAEAFQKFLQYIYTGKFENCSMDTLYNLYYITDKYAVLHAKADCAKIMSENLSVETFCDTITLWLRHEETFLEELLECASDFFAQNSKEIIQTAGWLSFLEENPVMANYFFKKLLNSLIPK